MIRTIIQLARHGDLLSMFPIARRWHRRGDSIQIVVRPEYRGLFDSIRYATPLVCDVTANDVAGALRWCRAQGLTEPLVTQVDDGKPHPVDRCRNFIIEQWTRAGYPQDFHRLPLVLDGRDRQHDLRVGSATVKRPDALAYCLEGWSSPCPQAPAIEQWIRRTFANRYPLLNLGKMRMGSLADFHPILMRCRRLITIDTGMLHLSHASRVPTIALQRSVAWYQSEPRQHWIERMTYEEAATDAGRKRIRKAVEAEPEFGRFVIDCPAPRQIVHVVNPYRGGGGGADADRLSRASMSWQCIQDPGYRLLEYRLSDGRHSGIVLGDSRQLPFVRDIFDFACRRAGADDIVVYTNADIGLCQDAPILIRDMMAEATCGWSARAAVNLPRNPRTWRRELLDHRMGEGSDLFAFTPAWWRTARGRVPDMVIGAEGWDAVMRWVMRESGGGELFPAVSWHQQHRPFWAEGVIITENPAQKHNRALAAAWAKDNGYGHMLDAGRHLFKAET
jgi:hypothetical protein